MLTEAIRSKVHAAIAAKARELGCKDVHVGGVPDHVHVLVDLPAVLAVADLVRHMKGSSSHLVNADLAPGDTFRWQGSYGALSVSPSDLERARRYVARQEEHHGANKLEPEFEQTEDNQEKPEPREGGALQR